MGRTYPQPAHRPRGSAPARPKLSSQELGRHGERLAADWYVARGYQILERNWRCRAGEIDLIVGNGQWLVFCEVKARSTDRFGTGLEAVTAAKQQRLRKLAAAYLASCEQRRAGQVRFDVAAVSPDGVQVVTGAF